MRVTKLYASSGEGESFTTVPVAERGINSSRYAFAAGLMQFGLMMFAVTQAAPDLSVNGWPVSTVACDATASARFVSFWYDPKKNSLFTITRPPADAPHWFCFCSGLRGAKKLRAFN